MYPGVGWVIWRAPQYLPKDLVFNINYLGADQSSFTLNFSKGASQIIAQYYQLIRLGKSGYRDIMVNLTKTADYLADELRKLGFIIMSEGGGKSLPLVAFRFPGRDEREHEDEDFDEFALAHYLRTRGWVVPAYTMAPDTDKMKMMRIVIREDFSRSRCGLLIKDMKLCCRHLEQDGHQFIKRMEHHQDEHSEETHRARNSLANGRAEYKVRVERAHCIANLANYSSRMRRTRWQESLARVILFVKWMKHQSGGQAIVGR